MTDRFPCPIIGCPHYQPGSNKQFSTLSHLIRHLKSNDHSNSRQLLDHNLCNKIKLYRCTHSDCVNNKNVFFQSHRALTTHYTTTHPLTCLPATTQDELQHPYQHFTNKIFDSPGNEHLINNWNTGVDFIKANYHTEPPHFRSTWRRFLTRNNLVRFNNLLGKLIHIIIQSTATNQADIFWWLLFNIERLVLAPTDEQERDQLSIRKTIGQRIRDLQCGNIEQLLKDSNFNTNWNKQSPRPTTRSGDKSAQLAADEDNYRTAITRACAFNKIATIDESNEKTVFGLYPPPVITDTNNHQPKPPNIQLLHLPGNICDTIRKSGKNKGTGILADSIDIFINLVKLKDTSINNNIQQIFNLIFQGNIPRIARAFFTDTYLFCLHKDPDDLSKLRPIGIPSAIRRIIASHIAQQWKDKFALHLLPYNFAVGIPNGMDFIIKTMQLSIEQFIDIPQQKNELPSRAAIFVDLTNMFNSVSRQELFDVINSDFPELRQLTSLLYEDEGTVKYKWKNKTWKQLKMKEGVNQGCPLSPIFATLVLHRVLKPLDQQLRQRAANRLQNGDSGDDGFGSIAHLLAYMDDISSTVHHEDVQFFCTEIEKLGRSRGCFVNPHKTRILTSCSGDSIIPTLRSVNPSLAQDIGNTIATYSTTKHSDGTTSAIELTEGFRLLGTPVGSATFARTFFDDQLKATELEARRLTERIPDLQTRLKLFSQCTIHKLPHLLDADVMHNHTPEFENDQWYNWNGYLTEGIDNIIKTFFKHLLDIPITDEIPTYSTLIAHLNINKGGLGILNASTRAAPNFVVNMMTCRRRISLGFQQNKDITPIILHTSIANLFNIETNHESSCLGRYHQLLPHISSVCNGPKNNPENSTSFFESSISTKSARDRLKSFCGTLVTNQIHSIMETEAPDHVHLLPSILSPQTSYPLIGMNRSNPAHRLPNWTFSIATKRKLRLPIYSPNNKPSCKCKRDIDSFGDHWFSCRNINKTIAHNIVRDSWATALQPALAAAGYINHSSKLDIERTNLPITEISARPFDFSFDPDSSGPMHTPCPYTTIGFDITITNSCVASSTNDSSGDAPSRSASADLHLQEAERKKLMRRDRKPDIDYPLGVKGEQTMHELIVANMLLIPLTLDPHGRWGPIMENFLNLTSHNLHYQFKTNKPNAATMLSKITRHPCPIGILKTADSMWKTNKTGGFFGFSYTSPTPTIFTTQQLGLGITKAFATHIKNAEKRSSLAPALQTAELEAQDSLSIGSFA